MTIQDCSYQNFPIQFQMHYNLLPPPPHLAACHELSFYSRHYMHPVKKIMPFYRLIHKFSKLMIFFLQSNDHIFWKTQQQKDMPKHKYFTKHALNYCFCCVQCVKIKHHLNGQQFHSLPMRFITISFPTCTCTLQA